jgi:hypothetical protein
MRVIQSAPQGTDETKGEAEETETLEDRTTEITTTLETAIVRVTVETSTGHMGTDGSKTELEIAEIAEGRLAESRLISEADQMTKTEKEKGVEVGQENLRGNLCRGRMKRVVPQVWALTGAIGKGESKQHCALVTMTDKIGRSRATSLMQKMPARF